MLLCFYGGVLNGQFTLQKTRSIVCGPILIRMLGSNLIQINSVQLHFLEDCSCKFGYSDFRSLML